jgi:hypothetical protein
MFQHRFIRQIDWKNIKDALLLILGALLLFVLVSDRISTSRARAGDQTVGSSTGQAETITANHIPYPANNPPAVLPPDNPASWHWIVCTPANVMVYSIRIHVKCTQTFPPSDTVQYFAAPTSDAPNVARILSLLTAAKIAGRDVTIGYYDEDTSGVPWGCDLATCRPILAVGIEQ